MLTRYQPQPMLTESEVIAAIRRFLKRNRFRFTRLLSDIEHGVDVQALTPDGRGDLPN
jgi:hypothetical protein